ncbi:hypothetical protein QTG54_009082 [Skeletonema marinoi]|uniref:RING-CH-type domain-containing protein n=1 Tax=Skeletonema marinoi TaxID=267567 RepID=A0AAD8Y601_9STRA|nr:hypothetical protein QTG54_009082 [Skeletonema marinoi]
MITKSQSAAEAPSCTPPDGASCWLCLEEGPDDSGAPLVRDCSCRGHSGFAHLQCLVQYAKSKTKDFAERGELTLSTMFVEKLFERCPNCKQEFQGDLYYEMTKAQLSFVEKEFKGANGWYIGTLTRRIHALDGGKEEDRIEGEEICAKMLSLIDEMKKNGDPQLDAFMLASVYHDIGRFNYDIGTNQRLERAKRYLEISRDVFVSLGGCDSDIAVAIEGNIANVEARLSGSNLPTKKESDLSAQRARYNCMMLRVTGQNDVRTTQVGVHLATALFEACHTLEALRLLEKLAGTSRRVHGSDHRVTADTAFLLKQFQARYVSIGNGLNYQALRYENDGKSCVIQGPVPRNIFEPRNVDDEKTFSVPTANIYFSLGSPVMLHGLKKAAHLNGEIGDVRGHCELTDRCVVHLEGKDLKPVKVKHENLRIVFDVADPKKESS